MTSERTRQTTPEAVQAEHFLFRTYNITADWLRRGRRAQVIRQFDPEAGCIWENTPSGQGTLTMDLMNGIILQDGQNIYGLAPGRRRRSRFDRQDYQTFQFGFSSSSDWSSQKYPSFTELGKLRQLAAPSPHNFKRAEFFYNGRRLMTDCWMDESRYGGRDINWWEESAIGSKGETAVVNTIKRLVRNFDPV